MAIQKFSSTGLAYNIPNKTSNRQTMASFREQLKATGFISTDVRVQGVYCLKLKGRGICSLLLAIDVGGACLQ